MRRASLAFVLAVLLAASARAQKTPPKLAPCDTSSVLAKATPIYDVGTITLGKACPAFAQAVRSWYAADSARHGWTAGQIIAALLAEPFTAPPTPPAPPSDPAPPLGADEPTFDPATATMVYSDNMDRYTTAAAMGATGQTQPLITPNPSPLTTSSAVATNENEVIVGRGGTGKALRMHFTGQTQTSATFITWNMPTTPTLATHVFQYWARVQFAAPLGSNGTQNTLAVKWFEAWHVHQDRVQWNTHDHLPCKIPDRHATYWQVYDQGRETVCQGNQPIGPYLTDVANGQWHRFTYEYRPNSAKGARDGFARMWIDGVKVIDVSRAAIGVVPAGGEWAWCTAEDVDALAVNDGMANQFWGSTQTTNTPAWTYDVDDYRWWIRK